MDLGVLKVAKVYKLRVDHLKLCLKLCGTAESSSFCPEVDFLTKMMESIFISILMHLIFKKTCSMVTIGG